MLRLRKLFLRIKEASHELGELLGLRRNFSRFEKGSPITLGFNHDGIDVMPHVRLGCSFL